MPGSNLPAGVRWILVILTGAIAGLLFGLIAVGIGRVSAAIIHAFGR
jgi:hypothetical protein